MCVSTETALALSTQCGFSHAALLPVRPLDAYFLAPTKENSRGIFEDPYAKLPEVKSVLIAAMPFHWHTPWSGGNAEVSAFYFQSQKAHAAIRDVAAQLSALGAKVCNFQELPQKVLGREAGLGVQGRNSLLRNTAWGSCLTLRMLLTDIEPEAEPVRPFADTPACGACRRCVDACPTGALDGNGGLDRSRCLRGFMMQAEPVPEALRAPMGTRLLGCEICQRACPHNQSVPCVFPEDQGVFAIDKLLAGARSDLDEIAGRIGWNEARLRRVQAQAALAAGNSGDARYLPALRALENHEQPAIAGHARWAIAMLERG